MSHDLTFVAPERRGEVRRRIAAVESFIATPGRRAAEAVAIRLGLSVAQFYNLVRAWQAKRQPEAMMGRHASRDMRPRIDRSVLDLIEEVIVADQRAAAVDAIDRVGSLARDRGIALPDPSTVARYVRRKRPSLLTDEQRSGFDLIVDHTVVDLPVDFGDGRARRPLVTIVIDVGTEAPVALTISTATPGPATTAAAVLDALRGGTRHAHGRDTKPRVGIVAMSQIEAASVIDLLKDAYIEADLIMTGAHSGGLFAESLLGREPAGLLLKQRFVWHDGNRRLATTPAGIAPLTPADALALIRGRLLGRQSTTVFGMLDNIGRCRLTTGLAEIAQAG